MGQRGWWTPRSLACSSPSQGKERRGRSRRKHRLCCPSACLLARLPAGKLGSQFWGICASFTCTGPRALFFSPMVPQQCLVLSKLQGGRWPCLPGQVLLMVSVASLLRYTLPASAGGANSPRNTRPGRSQWCCEMSQLCSMSVLALFLFPELDAVQHSCSFT